MPPKYCSSIILATKIANVAKTAGENMTRIGVIFFNIIFSLSKWPSWLSLDRSSGRPCHWETWRAFPDSGTSLNKPDKSPSQSKQLSGIQRIFALLQPVNQFKNQLITLKFTNLQRSENNGIIFHNSHTVL